MLTLFVQFLICAVLAAIFLWALGQFPTLDGFVVKFIRVCVLVVLSVMLLNLLLVLLLGKGLTQFLR